MADKKTYTGLSKNYATVPAFSITTIDYLDTKPNYFRVQNRGTTELYCSTNNMPTAKHYDFAVAGKKMKMFAEPYNRTRLYIFNPSGSDVEVAVLSFQAEFEPLTLALSEIEVEMPKDFESSMAITSFNAPLPTGNNKIGKVEVEMPKDFESSMAITSFNASLPTGNNKIGKVEVTNGPADADVAAIKEDIAATNTKLNSLMSNLQLIVNSFDLLLTNNQHENFTNLPSFIPYMQILTLGTFSMNVEAFEKENISTETTIYYDDVPKYINIIMLKNDGNNSLSLQLLNADDSEDYIQALTLKSGESITGFKFWGKKVAISGTNYTFRALVSIADTPTTI